MSKTYFHPVDIDDSILFNLAFLLKFASQSARKFLWLILFRICPQHFSTLLGIMISYETADDDQMSAVCNNLIPRMSYMYDYDAL